MRRGRTLLRYFTESDLEPLRSPERSRRGLIPILSPEELKDIRDFAEGFGREGETQVSAADLAKQTHVGIFLRFCVTLGAVSAKPIGDVIQIRSTGRLGQHVPEILSVFLENDLTVFPDWERRHVSPEDEIGAVEFVQHLELRRIAQERQRGQRVRHLAERPVAFAVFHAKDIQGTSCFLFEFNKDWRRLNLVGGKQEPEDGGDYETTALREIEEELGVSHSRIRLTAINRDPIIGYSLSGNVGSLARYPCVLFGAAVKGSLGTKRPQHHWLTEEMIREVAKLPDGPLMVNPSYLDFLLDGSPSRLSALPVSTAEIVQPEGPDSLLDPSETTPGRWGRVIRENKDLAAAVITLVAAVITLALAL